MTFKKAVSRVLFLSALTLTACDSVEPYAPANTADLAAARLVVQQGTDDQTLSKAIPGYGGLFLIGGAPAVYVTDMRQATRARMVLSGFAAAQGKSDDDIVVLQGAFKREELDKWHDEAWEEALDVRGAVFSDVDEAHNKVLFGVEDENAARALRGVIAKYKIPAAAVQVDVVEPIKLEATLRDKVDPKVGGLQIHFTQYLCTMGFNASFGGTASFITNSHCTATQGNVQGTQYYQPTSTISPVVIGTEVADPEYSRGRPAGCPKNKRCRYSDSARANYAAGITSTLGGIAATSGANLTITGTHTITAEGDANRTPVPVGGTVSKTGRTTGTSTGIVTNTCVNTAVSGSSIMQLCQTFVNAAVGGGDSGSPVYTGSGNVTLVGILWGGNGAGTQFVFSPLRSIKDELGNFVAR